MSVTVMPPYTMREPCRWCLKEGVEVHVGAIIPSNGQDVVRCKRCNRQCYNAPRAETGKPQRNIRSRPDLSFGQRERILRRDSARCFLCGRDPAQHGVILNVAHVLSVHEGRAMGVEDEILFDDANLVAACEECNQGMGKFSLEPRIWLALCRAQMRRNT